MYASGVGTTAIAKTLQVERELSPLVTKMDRLMDALAEGTEPNEEIIPRRV